MFRALRASKAIASAASRACVATARPAVTKTLLAPAFTCQAVRTFTATSFKQQGKLAEALLAEIEHEEGNDEVDKDLEDVQKLIQKSFQIHDQAGEGVVKLTRTHGDEKIEVTFDVQDSAETDAMEFEDNENNEEDGENAGDLGFGVNFEVTITRGEKQLVINCVGSDGITVQNIRHVATSRGAEDSDVYAGPNFDDLDDAVTEAFLDYLEERKIDADLGYFVLAYSREKEQREYVNWLKNIQSFVTK